MTPHRCCCTCWQSRRRRAGHGAVGAALEQLYDGRTEAVAELLALHFGRSNDLERAVDYAIMAGEKAQRRWANSDALAYFADALRRLGQAPDTEANRLRRIDAVLKQGDGRFAVGRHADHLRALDEVRELVLETADPGRRATWHYWRGFAHMLVGEHPAVAIEHCNQAKFLAARAGLKEIEAFAASLSCPRLLDRGPPVRSY
jgi:hypothetical protein